MREIARLLSEGFIGRPISTRAHWGEYLPGWHPWEDYRRAYSARADLGGGVVLTLCHPFDYLRWLLGEVKSIWAFAGQLGDLSLEVEDSAEIGLRFASGGLGSLHLDYYQRPPTHHLEIIGTRGTIRWDNHTGALATYRPEAENWQVTESPAGFDRNQLFMAEMRHFLAVARGEARPLCTLEDGRRALELALAALKSAELEELIQV